MYKDELAALVTTQAAEFKLPELIQRVTQDSERRARGYGMQVANVEVKLLHFPDAKRQAVFARMKAERKKIALQYRMEQFHQLFERQGLAVLAVNSRTGSLICMDHRAKNGAHRQDPLGTSSRSGRVPSRQLSCAWSY